MNETPCNTDSGDQTASIFEVLSRFGATDEFDRITALVQRVMGVPICLVTVLDGRRLLFLGSSGLPPEAEGSRETPLEDSVCQLALGRRGPMVIPDAARDERVRDKSVVRSLPVGAYLGYPLVGQEGEIYGTLCIIDSKPRDWNEEEQELVREFTALVSRQLDLGSLRARQQSSLDVVIHDLKSPLSGIQMVAGLLEDQIAQLPEGLRPLTESLTDSVDKAMKLVVSLGQRDRGAQVEGCDDPGRIVREQIALQRPAADEKSLIIDISTEDAPLRLSVADWVVERIVENLLSNAIKFTPVGKRVRVISAREGGSWILQVNDEGPGFTIEDRSRLYRRYAQLSARPTAGEPSSGLGLSIVKRLVDQEGGAIELESAPGDGATFTISFPLAS